MGLGTLGLCGLLTQGTGYRVCSPTLPWHHPFFGVLSSDLGWSRQAKPWHVHGNPHEGLGASSPAPSAATEPLLPPTMPGPSPRGSCLLPVPHWGHFPSLLVGGFDSCLALYADVR